MHDAVTVLGGGNTAFAMAANLALRGVQVTLAEHPEFAGTLDPIRGGAIRLAGVAGEGIARVGATTTDFGAALRASELLLASVPAYAHRAFAAACAPHLRSGHILVLLPGTLGTLEAAEILRAGSRDPIDEGIVLAETDTSPYVCRKTAPDTVTIWGVASGLGVAALPASATERVVAALAPLFTVDGRTGSPPALRRYPNVLACGLAAMNPVVHPAGVLLNAGRIERSRGEFYFYEEGVTSTVCGVIEAVDRERLALAAALDLDLPPVGEAFHLAGFGPRGDLWSTINGSRMLTALRAPGAVATRWLTEDVPYGLACWAELGDALGVDTPTMDALVHLGLLVSGAGPGRRRLRDLGLEGLNTRQMRARARGDGSGERRTGDGNL